MHLSTIYIDIFQIFIKSLFCSYQTKSMACKAIFYYVFLGYFVQIKINK